MKFVIKCDCYPAHIWMSFATWYSINKFFPDAENAVAFNKKSKPIIFNWVNRLRPRCVYYNEELISDGLILPCSVIAIRESDLLGPVSSKTNEFASLIDYSFGCGKIEIEKVLNQRNFDAFSGAYKRFATENMFVNETKVLESFDQLGNLYRAFS